MRKLYFLSLFLLTSSILIQSCQNKNKNEIVNPEIVNSKDKNETKTIQEELENFEIDTERSFVEWIGTKTTGSHNGTIKIDKGAILMDKKGEINSGKFIINMNSIECTDLIGGKKESIEEHLKDEDFFNTIEYPNAYFTINEVVSNTIFGTLTIKDITVPINFEYNKLNDFEYEAEIVVNRTLFDIKYKSKTIFPELGDHFIHDDFIIKLNPLYISIR